MMRTLVEKVLDAYGATRPKDNCRTRSIATGNACADRNGTRATAGHDSKAGAPRQAQRSRATTPIPFRAFPVDALPEPARQFVATAAKAIGCDPSYVTLPLLSALAAAIGNTRRIKLKRGWTEPAVIWAAVVGESGTLKSPASDAPLKPVRERQAEALRQFEEALVTYRTDHELYLAELAEWKAKGRKNGEPQPSPPEEPTCERLWCSDITVEALASRLVHAPRGLLLVQDELAGWLNAFNQYKAGRGADTAHWLAIFGARDLLVDRKTGDRTTIYVPHAAVSISGGIQPRTLGAALGREHFEDGLAARLLLAMPPRLPKRWTEAEIPSDVEAAITHVFDRLWSLQFDTNTAGQPCPVPVRMTPEGKRAWVDFYDTHAKEQTELTGDLAAAWSKLECYAARLALVVHFVRWADEDPSLEDPDAVDAQSVTSGVTLVKWFGEEVRRVYAVLSESEEDCERRRLIELIARKGGRITARELRQSDRRFRDSTEEAEIALNELFEAGYGHWEDANHNGIGGRSTRAFCLDDSVYVYETPSSAE